MRYNRPLTARTFSLPGPAVLKSIIGRLQHLSLEIEAPINHRRVVGKVRLSMWKAVLDKVIDDLQRYEADCAERDRTS